ncbi:Small GTPase-like protein LIP2 [Gracilariopsis chorda]|uniref:Small GTPase-like protein LIP2 n=1 Tax=Gracilariopsis chorda TaxID=448386 RepID=A0A2V3J1U1_9FLOR|nr:Small GTPase-like protein LIP2 [Gracilariopsis chorda]|eukprot:PXF48293.1 Small GTPase-like protein LIP2 [Gracilariopsis chorda]
MEPTNTIRILVVGDDNVGKSTLVRALCGLTHDAKPPMACRISVRAFEDHIQEFYDIPGSPHFQHGRKLFFSHTRYNAVLFVYDVSDPATRSSVSCVWVPEVMVHLGDAGAVESGGRLDGSDIHVRSRGALNELRFLWRQAFFSHGAVSPIQAGREALRLLMRLFRLILNETGVWTNSSIDREAERMFLATSTVPVAIVGMKADLVDRDDLQRDFLHDHPQAVPHLRLHANNAAHDVKLAAFLKKVADSAKRKPPSSSQRLSSRHSHGHMMIGFS